MALSTLIVPVLLTFTACFALGKRVDVYSALTKGAEEGLTVLLHILPSLIALLSAVYMFRASGAMEALSALLAPALDKIGIPAETAPLLFIRPISGSGALAVGSEIMDSYGVDSYIGRVAEPQQVGGEVGGDHGQRLTVAARVRQEPLEQRAEEGSESVGEMTLVHHFHHARPEAHHAAHRQTQLDRALRALERGSAERIQVSRQRAENERDCHHSRPKPGHCHVHQLLCP